MDKYSNISTHELGNVIGGSGIADYVKGKPNFSRPVFGFPTPVKPKTVTI